jgi:MFS family permease
MVNNDKSKSNMQKVALTALAGTSIEWYDFFLYGAAAALIFPTAFFGEATPSTALILSLLTFAAGFIARPIGGIIFGHYGDKVGRKKNFSYGVNLNGGFFFFNWIATNICNGRHHCANITYLIEICSRACNWRSMGRGNAISY